MNGHVEGTGSLVGRGGFPVKLSCESSILIVRPTTEWRELLLLYFFGFPTCFQEISRLGVQVEWRSRRYTR